MSRSLDEFARSKLDEISARDLTRRLTPTERGAHARGTRAGRALVSFSDNDYLGLTQHPAVISAAVAATEAYGAGAGASRLVTGDHPLYGAVEGRLARIKGTEAAIVFGSGYLANIGIIPALAGPSDVVIADELVHACMHAGARLSGAPTHFFRHNDAADCARLVERHRADARHCLILTEGVFSMDGDLAPVAALSRLARTHDAWLLVDDAHALGVIGEGRGSGHGAGEPVEIDLQMGTLSKAVGAYGGYLAASRAVIELMVNRARSLIFTTGLPPGVLAAADAALALIETDRALTAAPLAHARAFTDALGLAPAESAVVPIVIGGEAEALAAAAALADEGFLVTAIRPPTVPPGTARLRVTFSAAHARDDVERLARAIARMGLFRPARARA